MTAVPYARRSFSGGAIATTIPTGLGASDTSFTVALAANWPSGSGGDFYVDVDRGLPTEEKILCSSTSSLVITVASGGRGADGTSAVAHSAGCTVQVVHVGQDDDEANQVVNAVLGQPSAAKGDLLAMLSAAGPNTLTRVPIGSAGQLLGVSSGLPAWQTVSAAPVTNTTTAATVVTVNAYGAPTTGTAPAVTVTTLTSAIVTVCATWTGSVNSDGQAISFAVSGATTLAASDANGAPMPVTSGAAAITASKRVLVTGLTAGSNVFTMKFKVNGTSTMTLTNMNIIVEPQAT